MKSNIELLRAYFKKKTRVIIAFSGGVDSGLLLYLAHKTLGVENVLAVIVDTDFTFTKETDEAIRFCKDNSIRYKKIQVDFSHRQDILENSPSRCYLCKQTMFAPIIDIKEQRGYEAVVEGTNADDLSDFRPGMRATEELGVEKPYLLFGIGKKYIRHLASLYKLPFARKPAMCCAATRIIYGEMISVSKLNMIRAAEHFLRDELGIEQVRVRFSKYMAIIETDEKGRRNVLKHRLEIVAAVRRLGFQRVLFDLEGYKKAGKREINEKKTAGLV